MAVNVSRENTLFMGNSSMWQTFLKAHQQASSTPDALFHRLRKAKIKAISVAHCQQVINALTTLEKSQHHGFFYLPLHQALRKAREEISSQSLDENLQSLKYILRIGEAGKANIQYYQSLQNPDFWSAQFQAVRHDRAVYHKMILVHRQFLKESRYAIYSTQGLLWVYNTIFPVLTEWLIYANKEFALKHQNLDPILARRYQRLLRRLDVELTLEKQRIREVLYRRLVIGRDYQCLGVEYELFALIKK